MCVHGRAQHGGGGGGGGGSGRQAGFGYARDIDSEVC
jgi:hypothetical protein